MNALQILQNETLAPMLVNIATAITGASEAAAEASEVKASVSEAKRQYAAATASANVAVSDARSALELYLTSQQVKAAATHGNHFAGYRQLLASGADIFTMNDGKPATDKDAQNAIASDDVKELNAIHKAITSHVSDLGKQAKGEKDRRPAIDRLRAFASQNGIALPREDSEDARQVQAAVAAMVA